MKRVLHMVGYVVTAWTMLVSQHVAALGVVEPPPVLPSSPLVISAYYIVDAQPYYIELYNSSNEPLLLDEWTVGFSWALKSGAVGVTSQPLSLPLSSAGAYLPGKQHTVLSFGNYVEGASLQQEAFMGEVDNYIQSLSLKHVNYIPYEKVFTSPQSVRMQLNQTTTGYTTTGTYHTDTRNALYDSGVYVPSTAPAEFPLAPVEILANPRSCSPTENDTACGEYVKFYNHTTSAISFEGLRLRIGYRGQDTTSSNTVNLAGIVAPGQYVVFDTLADGSPIGISNSGGYVWLEDRFGIKVYEETVVEYPDASSTTRKGYSWAKVGSQWQWSEPAPTGANSALPKGEQDETADGLKPCRSDQYRNPATNRCRLIVSATSNPVACASNQFRNPETGRCKLLSSSTSSLKPCAPNQFRNPETNRCKSLASAASSLKPCAPGQARNPETNRCRKTANSNIPQADFAVEPFGSTTNNSLGWTGLALVGTAAVGYGVWEWRRELGNAYSKLKKSRSV